MYCSAGCPLRHHTRAHDAELDLVGFDVSVNKHKRQWVQRGPDEVYVEVEVAYWAHMATQPYQGLGPVGPFLCPPPQLTGHVGRC